MQRPDAGGRKTQTLMWHHVHHWGFTLNILPTSTPLAHILRHLHGCMDGFEATKAIRKAMVFINFLSSRWIPAAQTRSLILGLETLRSNETAIVNRAMKRFVQLMV